MIPFFLRAPQGTVLTQDDADSIRAALREASEQERPLVVASGWDVLPNAAGLVTRLRELHFPRSGPSPCPDCDVLHDREAHEPHCASCADTPWPCPTAQALDTFAPELSRGQP